MTSGTGVTSHSSSPVDFAFEPPHSAKPDLSLSSYSKDPSPPSNQMNSFPFNQFPYYSGASSFSSATSGSVGGSSFSSTDANALPAISRDFARPSPTETRRPATAGGALQSRSPAASMSEGAGHAGERFQRVRGASAKPDTIDENAESGVFTNPFASPAVEKQVTSQEVDPRFVPPTASSSSSSTPANRRASEPQQYQGWTQPTSDPMTAPAHVTHFLQPNVHSPVQQMHRPTPPTFSTSRPQTSDGLPSYAGVGLAGNIPLPSARTLVSQIDQGGYPQPSSMQQPPVASHAGYSLMPFRDARASMPEMMSSYSSTPPQPINSFPGNRSFSLDSKAHPYHTSHHPQAHSKSELTFVQLGGPTPKKRPRRRFDEIERLYACGWNGCEKSYGTLNHLNAHVAMQKHGEKRLPSEFKEMRKAWRKKKREINAASNNGQYSGNGPSGWSGSQPRGSIASTTTDASSDFDRRGSSSSEYSSRNGSIAYPSNSSYGWTDSSSRPNTASSVASSAGGAGMATDSRAYLTGYNPAGPYGSGIINPVPASARRASAPQHVNLPPPGLSGGFRPNDGDHPTPTQQNPFPYGSSSGMRMGGMGQSGMAQAPLLHQHQQPQPPQQGAGQFPFQALTAPVQAGGTYGQFAFQR